MTSITATTAACGGNITSGGGSAVTVRGVCWSTSQSFTIDNCLNKTTDGADVGSFTSVIAGLNQNTPYYVRAYATNSTGTGYGNLLSFTSLPGRYIGESYGGEIIFYIDGTGQHGLIAATNVQSTGAIWGCSGTRIDCPYIAIGTGQANTTKIVNGCSTAGIAARICDDLVENGYSDWFLPSKDELNQMYIQRIVIGGFGHIGYWSSSEQGNNNAWCQVFDDGIQASAEKGGEGYVRAIRAF